MATVKLWVTGMHCAHCQAKVEQALKGISGVYSAVVDLQDDPSPTALDAWLPEVFAIVGQPDLPGDRLDRAPKLRGLLNVEGNFFPNVDYETCYRNGVHVLGCGPAYASACSLKQAEIWANTPAIRAIPFLYFFQSASRSFSACPAALPVCPPAHILCRLSMASRLSSNTGITRITLGALNLLYMGSTFSKIRLNSGKYPPQLIRMASRQVAAIHHLCLLSNTKRPSRARQQIIAPA